ncbi:LLM class flavin-dependent oxidoreductase [Micromonospora sp. NBC_01813]|uniref:LLM class flavin-dependent oxidoreductase n=1 Tax=Micromonospora sp. NBC_01813 TaxID=2975988 RepID=UPI002DD7FB5D|nr:LLM class flavin-dependent oxidoreductase [Micromonospora sp. NBC_01813]WSA06910.1 LLM class flavin-dependent oxidoreductase [Micromonospora sp. NBC_01813]
MTDYGHDLLFGTFVTPVAEQADRVVALAQLTEEVGLDLVTVQDHPYQARFLDTWTLLSVIAASTSRVRVSPNVANLPLRQPAVLARSAATLDLLTGGRVELGLGAGAFWDAIAAMGGGRLKPAESVQALEEAIAIIRAIWDVEGGAVKIDGTHHRVWGAHPGPAPAHDIGIWLGAYKKRMLGVTGRLADGWLPSSPYAPPEQLPAMNAVIDDAARQAGRDPAAIRRLYNISGSFGTGDGFLTGTPAQWAEQLAELTLEHGFSGYILTGDDPDMIRRYAAEVVPAVRDLVSAGRSADSASSEGAAAEGLPSQAVVSVAAASGVARSGASAAAAAGITPTPDDGVRLSDERPWDESSRPTAPAPDPSLQYSNAQRAAGKHLIDVHDHLRSELRTVRDLIGQVAAGTVGAGSAREHINTMTMRQNNWTLGAYCESYCRVVTTHHTIEDISMLPQLRRADPALAPVVDRLAEEHKIIHDVLERVDRALVALVSEPGRIGEVQAAVDLLTDTLLSHLSYEERELVEPLARFSGA